MSGPNDSSDTGLWCALNELASRYWYDVDFNGGRSAHEFYQHDGLYTVGQNRFEGRDGIKLQEVKLNISNDVALNLQVGHLFNYSAPGTYTVTYDLEGTITEPGNLDFSAETQVVIKTGGEAVLVIQAIPEPSTWAMMILGFLGLGLLAYRNKNTVLLS